MCQQRDSETPRNPRAVGNGGVVVLNAPYDGVAEWTDAVSKSSAVSVSGPEGTCPGTANAMIPFSFFSFAALGAVCGVSRGSRVCRK